jgi:AraC-like DNA-binding protein
MSDTSSLAAILQVVWRLMELYGIDPAGTFHRHGIDPTLLRLPKARIAMDRVEAMAGEVAHSVRRPGFALDAARVLHPSSLGVLGYAWLSSSTLRTGLERLTRYWKIIGNKGSTELVAVPEGLKLVFRRREGNPRVDQVVADFTLSIVTGLCRTNAGEQLDPIEVHLRRPAPADVGPYAAFFRCPVHFGADEDSLTLPLAAVDRPLPTANRDLAGTFDRMLAEQLAQLDRADVVARSRAVLLDEITLGVPSAGKVASRLHMSRRTLQRKLGEADASYQRLVEDTRRELAMRYVEDPDRSITDITFLLGFSQQSAFTRAFRRWTGRTPTQHRAESGARR